MSVNKVNSDGSLSRVAGGTLYADAPIGTISPFGGSVIPSGYLLCNGAEVLKTTYAELYAVIGDAFGTASDNTKFVLPDLRETVPVGIGENDVQTIAYHDVYTLGEFKDDSLGKHDHPLIVSTRATYNTAGVPVGIGNNNTPTTATHGKQLGVNYIIKAKQTAVPFDVSEYIRNQNVLSDIEIVTIGNTAETATTMQYDGFIWYSSYAGPSASSQVYVNGQMVSNISGWPTITIPVNKGDMVYIVGSQTYGTDGVFARWYKLRDYTGRI